MVKFDASPADAALIETIADRAFDIGARYGSKLDKVSTAMDLTATHLNGCPLDLKALSETDDTQVAHDVFGIARHIDRNNGKLMDCFRPRFAVRESAED